MYGLLLMQDKAIHLLLLARMSTSGEHSPPGKAVWDGSSVQAFCEISARLVQGGHRPISSLSKKGYDLLQIEFLKQTGRSYVYKQLKNKWDQLKKDYSHWVNLQRRCTGLGMDPVTGTVDASPEWWDAHVKVYPNSAKFRKGPPPHLKELEVMFSKAVVTGAHAGVAGANAGASDLLDDTNSISPPGATQDLSAGGSGKGKRRRSQSGGDDWETKPYQMLCKTIATSYEAKSRAQGEYTDAEILDVLVQAGAGPGTHLYYTAVDISAEHKYRNLIMKMDPEHRLGWLEHKHQQYNHRFRHSP